MDKEEKKKFAWEFAREINEAAMNSNRLEVSTAKIALG